MVSSETFMAVAIMTRNLRQVEDERDSWHAAAIRARNNASKLADEVAERDQEISRLQGELAKIRTDLADAHQKQAAAEKAAKSAGMLKDMMVSGFQAVVSAFSKAHPDSPLRAMTGQKRWDGVAQTKVDVIYNEAFDKKGRELGIANPAYIRGEEASDNPSKA